MIPAPFDYLAPESLEEAIQALVSNGEDARILAGGHSLLPMMKLRLARPKLLVDLGRVPGLNGVTQEQDRILIGAMTTHYQIESSTLLQQQCPLLPQTAEVIGDVQVRNCGTIGGSLAHADPAGDVAAAVLALGGELQVKGPNGERWIRAEDFFLGFLSTTLEFGEVVTGIRVPVLPEGTGTSYKKMAQKASGFAIVGVAVHIRVEGDRCAGVGIGVTGLGPNPFRAGKVEEALRNNQLDANVIQEAASQAAEGVDPLDDIHASAEYRSHLARVYTARTIQEAVKKVRA